MAIHDASPGPPSSSALAASSHRLPTVSATQALEDLTHNAPAPLKTGLSHLDHLLAEHTPDGKSDGLDAASQAPGLPPGSLVEAWGPSGSGKTTLAMTLAASALTAAADVIWIDLSTPLVPHRLRSVLGSAATSVPEIAFHHLCIPSLSHLVALLQNPPGYLPWATQSLLVIENLHHAVDVAYPRLTATGTSERAKWAASRRTAVLGSIASLLRRLLAVQAIAAAVVTTNASTRSRGMGASSAVLVPGLGGFEWERALTTRWALFRDFADDADTSEGADEVNWGKPRRFLGVTKLHGRSVIDDDGDVGVVLQFDIAETGIVDLAQSRSPSGDLRNNENGGDCGNDSYCNKMITEHVVSPSHGRPRKRDYGEIADSESDGEYGWDDVDGTDAVVAAEGLIDDEDFIAAPAEVQEPLRKETKEGPVGDETEDLTLTERRRHTD